MKRISVTGVVAGAVLDIVATNIVSIPLLAVAAVKLNVAQLPREQQTAALMAVLQPGSGFYVVGLLLGSACSVLGGYVAARIAKRDELLNGALSAVLCIAFGVYAWIKGIGDASPTTHAAFLALSPALGAFGGYLRQRAKPPAPSTGPTSAAAA